MNGRVLRVVASEVLVYNGNGTIRALCPKQIKLQSLCAGDFVEYNYDEANKIYVINSLIARVNHIDRPKISNVDNGFVVISDIPKADFYVVDRILITLGIERIKPYIIISKLDIVSEEFIKTIKEQYSNCVEEVLLLSSVTGEGIERFKEITKDEVSVLIGQSAVGKSSLLNKLGVERIKTDDLALKVGKKLERGKNTTKNSQLYLTNYGALVADTPGFKVLSLDDLQPEELMYYYVDLRDYGVQCKYTNCTHLSDNEGCAVVDALNKGLINKERYNRYIRLKNELTENRKKKYD